jgi:asparagine synthase (glutamine-hydrolysing)
MCGISGYFSASPQPAEEVRQRVHAMNEAIRYRGPDGEGLYLGPGGHIGFGHRRLAFLDLAPTGDQPMLDPSGRYALIMNGEIYNYRLLREKLLARGATFRSTGDCEVMLHLLIHEGVEALSQFRGMFVMAFWDEQQKSLLLARDRFGIKPMVYSERDGQVAFASEIKALRAAGFDTGGIDPAGFAYYLLWGSIAPPRTWLQQVHSLEPGTWRQYTVGQAISTGTFADMRDLYREGPTCTERELREKIGPAVEESVKLHLESDVPVGVFLSGGIDSSSLVSAVRQVTNSTVQTYTITFGESQFSEEAIARKVAERFETDHHVVRITAQDFLRDWPTIFGHYDQPTLDAFNSYYVSKAVRESGLKGVLSGTGGDEFFGGYPSFRWLPKMASKRYTLRWIGPWLSCLQRPHRRAKWKHLCKVAGDSREMYRVVRGLFMPHELEAIAGPALLDQWATLKDQVDQLEDDWLGTPHFESELGTVSRLESRQYLAAQLLRDIDVMSMAHSLEVRVPLIDHVLAGTLWPSLGKHPQLMQNKRLLYETLRQPLSSEVYDRPKQGFTFPMEQWAKSELQGMMRDGMMTLAQAGWIQPVVAETLLTGVKTGDNHWSRPWALAVFGHLLAMRLT